MPPSLPAPDQDTHHLAASAIARLSELLGQGHMVIIAFSGGKDSSVVLALALQAWLKARAEGVDPLPLGLVTGDTGIENPAVTKHMTRRLKELEAFARRHDIPLEIRIARPSLADSYLVQILSGRSLPTWVNSPSRNCSYSLKVRPGAKAGKTLTAELSRRTEGEIADGTAPAGWEGHLEARRDPSIAGQPLFLVGSRIAESDARAQNMERFQLNDSHPVASGQSTLVLAPIARWDVDHVWEFLALSGAGEPAPFTAWVDNFDDTVELYRDAAGECPVVIGEKAAKSPCGARHGCALCTVSGSRDKSLEEMLSHTRHAHLQDLNRLRNWLANARERYDLRTPVQRALDRKTGMAKLGAGGFRPAVLAALLRFALSIDAREAARAAELGQEPDFQLISLEALFATDFFWSLRGLHRPFHALEIFREIAIEGRDIPIPDLAPGKRQRLPAGRRIPAKGIESLLGLADLYPEVDCPEPEKARFTPDGLPAVPGEEAAGFEIDHEAAGFVLGFELDYLIERYRDHLPGAAALFYLRRGVVKLPRGRIATYDAMARYGQWLSQLSGIDLEAGLGPDGGTDPG